MKFFSRSLFILALLAIVLPAILATGAGHRIPTPFETVEIPAPDTIPLEERYGSFLDESNNPFDLDDPDVIEQTVEYDPQTNMYIITEKIGDDYFRAPTYMTFEEYLEWSEQQERESYFKNLSGIESGERSSGGNVDPVSVVDVSQDIIDRLFGGSEVDIRPQGTIDLTFGGDYQKLDNPILLERQRRTGGFDFDMDIQVSVTGQIGEKLSTNFNYNTKSTFAFENKLKLDYNSQEFGEDDIIKKIEAGDVSLPLRGSLIQGSQSLFGIKTELQFGRLRLTAIASQQRSEKNDISIQGGSVIREFQVPIDEYDENRHFFLSHFNRQHFEPALENLPQINSLFRITRLEVWVTNDKNQTTDLRDIVAISDLGESEFMSIENKDQFISPSDTANLKDLCGNHYLPANEANKLLMTLNQDSSIRYADNITQTLINFPFNLQQTRDFEKVRARLLSPSEYTYHPELGFVSLNIRLQPDQVLGIAYEYTYNGLNYKVGELTSDLPPNPDEQSVLFVKMLKSTNQRVDLPIWDLMMKNFYFIQGTDVNPEEFELDIYYEDPGAGFKRFLPIPELQNLPLITIFNLDNLNATGDPQPDGRFDFIPGLTIYPRQGKIMIPVLEPFGSYLRSIVDSAGGNGELWAYDELYDSTLVKAQEYPEFNRFTIKGKSQSSSSSDISLGAFNIPPGSVTVTAGGQVLEENVDYIIDYNIGRLKIINDTYLQPGTPINVSFEDNALFSFQKKTMLGLRADYEVSKHLNIGATYMHLFERPYTQKVNIGDDPINNKIYGLDLNYSKEAPWLTRFVDNIPLIDTKEPSNINFQAEVAALKPGHSRAINKGKEDKEGVVYIDDFEGTASEFDLRTPPNAWKLASIPQNATINNQDFFPEAMFFDSLITGYNRAHLSWYRIDRSIRGVSEGNPYTNAVSQQEIFPNRTPRFGPNDFRTFDLYYQPTERGQYNFDLPGGSDYSEGIDQNCKLLRPDTRWAGIQRRIDNTDFEQANYEALEFWMLNPFILDSLGSDGYLMINLGSISEDVLKDSRLMYEHGLPRNDMEADPDTTAWGLIPRIQPAVNAFSNEPGARERQDVGLDGLPDEDELWFYADYVNSVIASNPSQQCIDSVTSNPSNDNFLYFRDEHYDNIGANILTRYTRYNGTENNSPENPEGNDILSAYTNIPDSEDLNGDYSLNESESYWQYQIPITEDPTNPGRMQFSEFITDSISGNTGTWYRFRIPLDEGESRGGITDFRSIRFMRMYLTKFEAPIVLRFATLDLVRSQWRRYSREMCEEVPSGQLDFSVDAVSIEEHSARRPFNYVIPEGIIRERIVGSTYQDIFQNEQSLSLKFCNLVDDCQISVYKILNLDMRVFQNLQMFVHAEVDPDLNANLPDGEMTLFLRLGSDFTNNYYEYEVPLVISRDSLDPASKQEIWKIANELDFPLSLFTDLKIERNESGEAVGSEYKISVPDDMGNPRTVAIIGNPSLGYVRHVMIGIRNPDGGYIQPICGEVWVNELRAVGLDERGGVAGLARVDMQLADFGEVGLSTTYSSVGYGAIDQKLDERSKESVFQFDASLGLELGKFFGQESGVRIPFYAQYSVTNRTPRYDPYDLDLELRDKIDRANTEEAKDSIRDQAIDHSALKVISVTNMRKERTGDRKTPMPWDISNFSVSYSLTQSEAHNEVVEKDDLEHHKGSLDYRYSLKPLYIQPLKGLSNSKWLKPLTEININPIPNTYGFSTILDRRFGERSYRFSDPVFKTWFDKRFTWQRRYNLKWDLTKSIKIDFNATNNAVIDEPDEYVDRFALERIPISERRDSVWTNLKKFGRTKEYQHAIRVSYNLPTKLFPFLDWIRADLSVDAGYSWTAASENTVTLGNIIQNNQNRKATADLDFTRLYDKSPYLRKISSGRRAPSSQRGGPTRGRSDQDDARDNQKAGAKDEKKKEAEPGTIEKILIRPLLSIRKLRVNYTEDYSTVVPGFTPQSELFGMRDFNAPGWDFVSGFQPNIKARLLDNEEDWLEKSRSKQWITDDVFQNQPVLQSVAKTVDGRLTIEPFADFKIDIDAKRNFTENFSMFYKNVNKITSPTDTIDFQRRSPREIGSFTITYLSIPTLFKDDLSQMNDLFQKFEDNRAIISNMRGAGTHPEDPDYAFGFGPKQRDIVIPAFLSAYTDKPPESMDIEDAFDWLPRPNWQLTYNGLQKIPLFAELFSSVRLTHGYKSTLSINSFETDLSYTEFIDETFVGQQNPENINLATQNYFSRYIVPSVIIDEEFSPLVGVEVKTKNDINLRFNYGKRRGLRLGLTDYILEEDRATSIEFGFDYAIKNVVLPFGNKKKKSGSQKEEEQQGGGPVKGNNLELIFDFGFKDNITVNHTLDQESLPIPTRGTKEIVISPALRYNLNKNVDLRFFVNYRKSEPYTTITYPITRIDGGITVQITLE